MRTKEFLSRLKHDRIVRAIRDAESKTSGEIRVYIQRGKLQRDPLVAAREKFQTLEMDKARHRNAVLIFVVPRAHKFAVVGDAGIHEKCGEQFWQRVAETIHNGFRENQFTEGMHDAIRIIGDELATHFPPTSTSSNELPDDVIER